MKIEFHPLADKEVLKSHRRYLRRNRSRTAAARFLLALDRAVEEVAAAPNDWPRHLHDTRFRRFHRFPYYVVYKQSEDTIRIIAVPHNRRRPGYWKRRL